MTSQEFCERYVELLDSFEHHINESCHPAINAMYAIDPHDLVNAEACFANEAEAVGCLWLMLVNKKKQLLEAATCQAS